MPVARTSRVKARETVKASLQADGRVGEVPGSQTSPEKLLPASLMEKLASVLKATEKSYKVRGRTPSIIYRGRSKRCEAEPAV